MHHIHKKQYLLCCAVLLLLLTAPLGAADFGLITNQYVEYGDTKSGVSGEDPSVAYQADILPRLSFLLGDVGDGIVSAGMTLGWDDGFYYVPELLRTELSLRFGNNRIKFGRTPYADPLGFIASGLFDGMQYSCYSQAGTFSVGAWYTGLLYKENANITMTKHDQAVYESIIGYENFDDFRNTYFASRRLLASFDWEHPSIGEVISLKAALTGQVDFSQGADFSKKNERYHSEYFSLKAGIPVKRFLFELGGSLEAAQSTAEKAKDTLHTMAFAFDMGIFWRLPTNINSRLSLTGSFASGTINNNDVVSAFVPITTTAYGDIFEAKLSGITVLGLQYTARLHRVIGTSLSASHFVRNDTETYRDYPVSAGKNSGHFLGTEFFGRLILSPVSDLQFNIGGGAFLPVIGDVSKEAKPLWRVELTAIWAIF